MVDFRTIQTMLTVVEDFNNGTGMATVNFSVPDDVKAAFDKTFKGKNKSAVVAALMRKAVEEKKLQKRREDVFRNLTRRRNQRPSLSNEKLRAIRRSGRP